MTDTATMPYRPCVAVMLFNSKGEIWLGRRVASVGTDLSTCRWQCPQGGIDPDESPEAAAMRELHEETGCTNAAILAESRDWYSYDLPGEAQGLALGGKYRGQQQKWFAMHFLGDESEFNLIPPPPHKQEFDAWCWASFDRAPDLVVEFKRSVYRSVIAEFRPIVAQQLGLPDLRHAADPSPS